MGKVRELADAWDDLECASTYLPLACKQLRVAERADDAAHAAELEEKDRRIADLEAQLKGAQDAAAEWKHAFEAELAKRKDLPPLPDSVREYVQYTRMHMDSVHLCRFDRDLIDFVDTHYPKPLPQWEQDAQAIERLATVGGDVASVNLGAIAARIREANRDAK